MKQGSDERGFVATLRKEFDDSFAEAPASAERERVRLLRVLIAGHGYLVRLVELAGVLRSRRLTSIPSRLPEMLGLVCVRGVLHPVYDLGALLGHGPSSRCDWLGLSAGIAFAFAAVDGYVEVAPSSIHSATDGRGAVSEVVDAEGIQRPLIDIGSLVETIRGRVSATPTAEGG